MKDFLIQALPASAEQICTAVLTLITAILAAFRRGKKAGKKESESNQ
jgi:hypothetical protein